MHLSESDNDIFSVSYVYVIYHISMQSYVYVTGSAKTCQVAFKQSTHHLQVAVLSSYIIILISCF